MSNRIVVGTQWGDEGKAKIVDVLAQEADVVIRYSGGANAGHTVVVGGETFILHLIPSGILYPNKICILGNGTVIDPIAFFNELEQLKKRGISTEGRVFVSDRAHLVLSYHKLLDRLQEDQKGDSKIGTTMKGIGPAYTDKVARRGIRAIDLLNKKRFRDMFMNNVELIKKNWEVNSTEEALSDNALSDYLELAEKFSNYVTDVTNMVYDFTNEQKSLLFESAQGTFLDLDHGTYPYVTSSNPIAGNISNGVGISWREIDEVIGVTKAYTTRVGNGPFPTELTDDAGEELRNAGNEYGATTGRPRRCGWLDLVMLKRASIINGVTSLAITKMDILTSLTQFKACTKYRYNGDIIQGYPADLDILENCDPVYKEFQGWKEDISNANSYDELPSLAKDYLHEISEECNTPISIISIGKERKETIFV